MNQNKCQWIGTGQGCEQTSIKDRSYCQDHVWRVYQKGTALGQRKKDQQRALLIWDLTGEINQALAELEAEGKI